LPKTASTITSPWKGRFNSGEVYMMNKIIMLARKLPRPVKVVLKYVIGILKNNIIKLLNSFGYDLQKIDLSIPIQEKKDLELYERLYDKQSIKGKKFYNIGAGNFSHPYWTNIDKSSDWYGPLNPSSIDQDLFSILPIPITSDTAEVIYTSHTIEHINNEAAEFLFAEAYRILKKGGVFRVTCPDIDLEYRAYRDNDRDYFFWIDAYSQPDLIEKYKMKMPMSKASISQIFLAHFATHTSQIFDAGVEDKISDEEFDKIFREMNYEDALNYCTSKCSLELQKTNVGDHINWWNKAKIIRFLKNVGFNIAYESAYAQSFCPVLRNTKYFDNTFPQISLYVEAVK